MKLGQAKVPMIVTNHTYDQMGSMFPQKVMGGGSGLQYAASTIVFLSKKKKKEGTEVVGNIIHCKLQKSRITKENSMLMYHLDIKVSLNKHYGLLELAEQAGVFKKVSTRFELPDVRKDMVKKYFIILTSSLLKK
nr:MAG: hypothetical protein CM15mV30_0570 [uncultured marine virus]